MISRIRSYPGPTVAARREFFDGIAASYIDQHGDPRTLLEYRLRLLREMLPDLDGKTVMELGSGPADHLFALTSDSPAHGIAVDFSPAMIDAVHRGVAERQFALSSSIDGVVDNAETLSCFPDSSVDYAFSVGALEHIPRKRDVFMSVARVLRPGGVFACLTMNGKYLWHTVFGRMPGVTTRHLSSDAFLSAASARRLIRSSGLCIERLGYWSFVPAGDMSGPVAALFRRLDTIGRTTFAPWLRGGLLLSLRKPTTYRPISSGCGPSL